MNDVLQKLLGIADGDIELVDLALKNTEMDAVQYILIHKRQKVEQQKVDKLISELYVAGPSLRSPY